MFVQSCQLDKRHVNRDVIPLVKADDDAMDGKEQVVIRFLKGLGDSVKLALVRAGVVALCLSRHRAYKIGVNAHCKAYHIDCFLNVGLPISALLAVVNLVDYDIMLLFAIARDVESGEPGFAAVLRASQKIKDLLLLADYALLLLSAVGDALGTKYGFPIITVR